MTPVCTSVQTWLLILPCLHLFGCDSRKSYSVKSEPPGAEILVDGRPGGITPNTVLLDSKIAEHTIILKRQGYLTVEQTVQTKPLLEGSTQNCAAVACSPCCMFVPLALCFEKGFAPKSLNAKLERDGQVLEVVCRPVGSQVWVDGILVAQTEPGREETVEGNATVRYPADWGIASVPLQPGVFRVEIRAEGFQPFESQVRIRSREDLHLRLDLKPLSP